MADPDMKKHLNTILSHLINWPNKFYCMYIFLYENEIYLELNDIFTFIQYSKISSESEFIDSGSDHITKYIIDKYVNKKQVLIDVEDFNNELYNEIKKTIIPTQDMIDGLFPVIFGLFKYVNMHTIQNLYNWVTDRGLNFTEHILDSYTGSNYFGNCGIDILFIDEFCEYLNSDYMVVLMDRHGGYGGCYVTLFNCILLKNNIYSDPHYKLSGEINREYNEKLCEKLFFKIVKICRLKYYDIANQRSYRYENNNLLRLLFDDDTCAHAAANYNNIIAKYDKYINVLKSLDINSEYFDIDPVAARYRDENLLSTDNKFSVENLLPVENLHL